MRFSSRGYSLVEVMFAIAISAGVIGGGVVFLAQNSSLQSQSWSVAEVIQMRQRIFSALESNAAWQNTMSAPENATALTCLESGSTCAPGRQGSTFAIFDENNRLIFDGRTPTHGFAGSGAPCDGFRLTGGSPSCTFRFDLRWTRSCTTGNCTGALVRVTGDLLISAENAPKSLEHDRYNIPALYLEMPAPAVVPPVCQALTHTANRRNFTVAWTAGSGNGGAGGCNIQFQKNDSSWVNLLAVDCDAPGSAAGTVSLPTDGWPGGAWTTSAVRLLRNSDSTVLCSLGSLRCMNMVGSPTSTPLIDEDCNGQWNNTQTVTCGGPLPMATLVPGETYTCAPTRVAACGTSNFLFAEFHGNTTFYADLFCANMVAHSSIKTRATALSGPVPAVGYLMSYSTSWIPLALPQSSTCLGSYDGVIFNSLNVKGVKLWEPNAWWQATCVYETTTTTTYY